MSAGHLRFSAKQQKLYCHIHSCKIFVSMLHTTPSERKALPKNVLKNSECTLYSLTEGLIAGRIGCEVSDF